MKNLDMEKRTDMVAMNFIKHAAACLAASLLIPCASRAGDAIAIHGKSWVQAGQIMHQTDTIGYNYNGNWFQSATAQVTAIATLGTNWEGALGIGARQIQKSATGNNVAMGNPTTGSYLSVAIEPYITQARFTYTYGDDKQTSPLQLTFGSFNYDYNPDVRNLGLYLTRGTVYPAFVFSGFETDETIGIANIVGMNLSSHTGPFTHDVLLSSETKIKPLFDYSLILVERYQPTPSFKIGAGVNFYRLIPIQSNLTTPRDTNVFQEKSFPAVTKYDHNQFYVDTTGGKNDTVRFTFKGIKVDAFFSWDLKGIFGQGAMGPEDLKLYGEAALIGVKNYPGIYDNIMQRIPAMIGFNIPTFKLLDNLSVEVEWYGSPYRNDYIKIANDFSPIPVSNQYLGRNVVDSAGVKYIKDPDGNMHPNEDPYNVEDMHQDDWKWAIHGSKTIKDHIRISGQIANDHFRTGGTYLADTYDQAFTTMKDWYFMMKLGYFF